MGIVNLTPDSFSDGGQYDSADAALVHIGQLLNNGADIIDIGAESTRPNAKILSPDEEWKRLGGILIKSRKLFPKACISVDTRHTQTVCRALDIGVDWINDVSGGADAALLEAVAASSCKYVLMHSLTVPVDPSITLPENADAVEQVGQWARWRLTELAEIGIAPERVILDPGIGFGKTAAQSWQLIRKANNLMVIHKNWIIGHSRKSFFSAITQVRPQERDLETHIISAWLAQAGIPYVRVHDVAGTKRALAVAEALRQDTL